MSKINSKPKTRENTFNPFAQSTFGAQLTEATISNTRKIESPTTLGRRALWFVVMLAIIVGLLAIGINRATSTEPVAVNWTSKTA